MASTMFLAAPFTDRLPGWPVRDDAEEEAVLRVIRSGRWWREAGTEVQSFEDEFAAFLGAEHVRAVTNGTHAIELALDCLDIGVGDEVLVPACTFIATATAVLARGAVPIPVDVEPDTLCMDPSKVEAAITPRTRALLPVHMAGQPCDMDALSALAARHGLSLIEDAAHAHGASYRGARAGSLGRCAIFSFQAGKLMTAGEGGALVTSDPEIAARSFALHSCGRPQGDRDYVHLAPSSNFRMSELHAAVLRAQLVRLPEQLETREARAAYLDEALGSVEGVRPLARRTGTTRHSHYMYMLWFEPSAFGGRAAGELARDLRSLGLPAFRCFPPFHRTCGFEALAASPPVRVPGGGSGLPDFRAFGTPVAEAAGEEVIWLHHSLLLGDPPLLDEIVEAIDKIR
jgi:3-amino-5-hydroxybenzoate synthase